MLIIISVSVFLPGPLIGVLSPKATLSSKGGLYERCWKPALESTGPL
jgi:hypothetical protein